MVVTLHKEKLSPVGNQLRLEKGRMCGKRGILLSSLAFKLSWCPNHLEGLVKTQTAGLHPQSFCASRSGVGPKNVYF